MKILRKLSIMLLAVLLFATGFLFSNNNASAAETFDYSNPDQTTYESLLENGILGQDVTFSDFVSVNKENNDALERFLNFQSNYNGYTTFAVEPPDGGATVTLKPGDFLVTTSTSYGGVQGHAAIVLPNKKILHFPGKNSNIQVIDTFSEWLKKYPSTALYREPNTTIASEAATWAYNNYWLKNKTPDYSIDTSIYQTNPSYCSKIVWQAYYFGTGSAQVMKVPLTHIAAPYNLEDYFYDSYHPKVIFQTVM